MKSQHHYHKLEDVKMIDQHRRYRESNLRQLGRNNDYYDEDPLPRIPRRPVASTRHEHSDIFESLCVEAELDDMVEIYPYSPTIRRGSLQHTCHSKQDDVNFGTRGHRRCHSSYNTNNRAAHREEHQVTKDYILTRGDTLQEERLIFINNLYELSNGLRLLGGLNDTNMYSTDAYPILNYMLDFDDDDSVDMAKSKRKNSNSLSNQDDSHEFLSDDDVDSWLPSVDNQTNYVEYIMDLPPVIMEEVKSISEKRRRKVPSYQTLQKQMESQPISTLVKSMIHTCQNSHGHSTETTTSTQTLSCPKVCDKTNNNNHTNESYPMSNKPAMVTQIQCARGA